MVRSQFLKFQFNYKKQRKGKKDFAKHIVWTAAYTYKTKFSTDILSVKARASPYKLERCLKNRTKLGVETDQEFSKYLGEKKILSKTTQCYTCQKTLQDRFKD